MRRSPQGLTPTGVGPKIALVVLPFLAVAVAAHILRPELVVIPLLPRPASLVIGAGLLAVGLIGYAWTVRTFLAKFPTGVLITTGPFALCRNPLYAVMTLLVFPGVALLARSWVLLVVAAIAFVAAIIFSRGEDEALERVFGDEFHRYRDRVPAFIPFLGQARTHTTPRSAA